MIQSQNIISYKNSCFKLSISHQSDNQGEILWFICMSHKTQATIPWKKKLCWEKKKHFVCHIILYHLFFIFFICSLLCFLGPSSFFNLREGLNAWYIASYWNKIAIHKNSTYLQLSPQYRTQVYTFFFYEQ